MVAGEVEPTRGSRLVAWVLLAVTLTTLLPLASAANQGPNLEWATPSGGSHTRSTNQGFAVEVECLDDPEGSTVYVDFLRGSTVLETDTDAWGTSPSYTFPYPGPGTWTLKARCRDSTTSGPSGTVTWTVTWPSTSNSSPTIRRDSPTWESTTFASGTRQSFQVTCNDVDASQDLSAHWRHLRDGYLEEVQRDNDADIYGPAGNDAESFTFTGTGRHEILVYCRDDATSPASSPTLRWTVNVPPPATSTTTAPANAAPSITAWGPTAGQAFGANVEFYATARDADAKVLAYAQWEWWAPNGAYGEDTDWFTDRTDYTTRTSFTMNQAGPWRIKVAFTDQGALASAKEWRVEVAQPLARDPVASVHSPSATVNVQPGQSMEFVVRCTDADGNADFSRWFSPRYPGGNDEIHEDGPDWTEGFTESFANTGTTTLSYTVRAECFDTTGRASNPDAMWTVNVAPPQANRPPVASQPSPATGATVERFVGESQRFEFYCSDPDGSTDTHHALWTPSWTGSKEASVDWAGTEDETYSFGGTGSFTLTVRCYDEAGAPSNVLSWSIVVKPLPASPPSPPQEPSEEPQTPVTEEQQGTGSPVIQGAASIAAFHPPFTSLLPGDQALTWLTVRNSGGASHTFWVGFTFTAPNGQPYHLAPQTTPMLESGASLEMSFAWIIPTSAPAGSYWATATVWDRNDGGRLSGELATQSRAEALTVMVRFQLHHTQVTQAVEDDDPATPRSKTLVFTSTPVGIDGQRGQPSVTKVPVVLAKIRTVIENDDPNLVLSGLEYSTVIDYHSSFWESLKGCTIDETAGRYFKDPLKSIAEDAVEVVTEVGFTAAMGAGIVIAAGGSTIAIPTAVAWAAIEIIALGVDLFLCVRDGYEIPLLQDEVWLVVGSPASIRARYTSAAARSPDSETTALGPTEGTWRGVVTPTTSEIQIPIRVETPFRFQQIPFVDNFGTTDSPVTRIQATVPNGHSVHATLDPRPGGDGFTGVESTVDCSSPDGAVVEYAVKATWAHLFDPSKLTVRVDGQDIAVADGYGALGNDTEHQFLPLGNRFDSEGVNYGEYTVLLALSHCSVHRVEFLTPTSTPGGGASAGGGSVQTAPANCADADADGWCDPPEPAFDPATDAPCLCDTDTNTVDPSSTSSTSDWYAMDAFDAPPPEPAWHEGDAEGFRFPQVPFTPSFALGFLAVLAAIVWMFALRRRLPPAGRQGPDDSLDQPAEAAMPASRRERLRDRR